MTTAHPVNELLTVLGRRAVLELLWTLRDDGPLTEPDADTIERLEELRRNGLVAASDGDTTWDLTPDGRALADQLFTLATRAARQRGGVA